jgi:hypothetical protein
VLHPEHGFIGLFVDLSAHALDPQLLLFVVWLVVDRHGYRLDASCGLPTQDNPAVPTPANLQLVLVGVHDSYRRGGTALQGAPRHRLRLVLLQDLFELVLSLLEGLPDGIVHAASGFRVGCLVLQLLEQIKWDV